MQNVYINEPEFQRIITEMRNEQRKIEEVFGKVKKDDDDMVNYWSGDNGEEALTRLQKRTATYEEKMKYLDDYIVFLEKTLEAYREFENKTGKSVDANADIQM
jgi:uncharacterized protein YukE